MLTYIAKVLLFRMGIHLKSRAPMLGTVAVFETTKVHAYKSGKKLLAASISQCSMHGMCSRATKRRRWDRTRAGAKAMAKFKAGGRRCGRWRNRTGEESIKLYASESWKLGKTCRHASLLSCNQSVELGAFVAFMACEHNKIACFECKFRGPQILTYVLKLTCLTSHICRSWGTSAVQEIIDLGTHWL